MHGLVIVSFYAEGEAASYKDIVYGGILLFFQVMVFGFSGAWVYDLWF
jgi:hypothetical protein